MGKFNSILFGLVGSTLAFTLIMASGRSWTGDSKLSSGKYPRYDTLKGDTTRDTLQNKPYKPEPLPTFEPKDRYGNPFVFEPVESPLQLKDPSNLKMDLEIDTSDNYIIHEKIGDIDYRPVSTMTFDQFQKIQEERMIKDYWKNKSSSLDGESAVSGRSLIPPIYISPIFDRIFGGSYVDIKPNGYVNLDFGGRWQRIDNPAIPIRQQRNGGFQFNQQINMNVVGKIGDKLSVLANFDNNNTFDFENNLKVEYTGYDEDIIKKIEVGNVSMPLNNSLISGAQNLFGLKTQLQFGKLYVTALASTQRGKTNTITVGGGTEGQGNEFQVKASDYDENRHFFLGHFFRDNYERWLSNLPQILSGVNITRVEVYMINRNNNTQTLRNIAAVMDLGEGKDIYRSNNPYIGSGQGNVPNSNDANKLYASLTSDANVRTVDNTSTVLDNKFNLVKSTDYEVITAARKLDANEYTINPQLGYISLYRKLQDDEALAVSYEYTYNGKRYKVGELTEDYQNVSDNQVIYLKLLRPSKVNTAVPSWDLMMKNVYNITSSQINKDGFELRIIYRDDKTGIDNPSLHEGRHTKDIPLVQLFNLDRLNSNGDPQPDGVFDYVEGATVNSAYGDVIFPVLEPFGSYLKAKFDPDEQQFIDKYVYDTLYNATKSDAELDAAKNKFYLVGRVVGGSSSDISLPGVNIAQNSVRVIAGNIPLTEGVDYRVDYNLGKVSIINQSVLNSGKPIQIQYEQSDLFNFQARSLFGTRLDYVFNDNMSLGATYLYYNERPLVSRVSIGSEPVRNSKWGLDYNYRSDSRFLTKMVNMIPFISTKEPSVLTFNSEVAQLIPGTSNIVQGQGTSYIDDFESAITPYNLGGNVQSWKLAATPKRSDNLFDGGSQMQNDLSINFKRAKMAWYIIDNIFYRTAGANKPRNITDEDLKNHYVRAVSPQEIFRNRDPEVVNTNEAIFDLAYYPSERGPYNYNPNLTSKGQLPDPKDNWGGITRAVPSDVDFDKTNIQYIEFWLMDPFIDVTNGDLSNPRGQINDGVNPPTANSTGGKLLFDLGSISEDLMKDGRHAFENGLPADGGTQGTTENAWGRVTTQQYLTNAFDNSASARHNQDVGLDGLKDADEDSYFKDFISKVNVTTDALNEIKKDPSADDFHYFLGSDLDAENAKIIERYKNYNGMENNSPISTNSGGIPPVGSTIPDNEDVNGDNTISDLEEYYEYEVDLKPGQLAVGKNNIVDKVTNTVNGDQVSWYLFRIPIKEPTRVEGNISGFKSIQFMRTVLTGFSQPVVLRFDNFQLAGSQWRIYSGNLRDKELDQPPENYDANFTVSVVSYEANGSSADNKIPYVLPPGIKQDIDNTSPVYRRNNEQALKLNVQNLEDGDSRAVFKDVTLDLISYGRLKMFFHAESPQTFKDTVTAFLRLGTDYTDNYYEIEVPLVITPPGSTTPDEIWPAANNIDIALNDLYALKSERNRLNFNISLPFVKQINQYKVTVVGRPELSSIQTLMIGIRNPKTPDQAPRNITIWANELRVTDFDKKAGWAANARANVKLADFATVSGNARYTSIGFGTIQQNISERTRESTLEYDLAGNVALEKFFPQKWGLKIPLYLSYGRTNITPEYDPLDPDVPLEASLLSFPSTLERDNYKNLVLDRTTQRGFNFTNVGKIRTNPDAKSHIYDIENLSLTYAYSETSQHNIYRAEYINKSMRAGITYNFNPKPVSVEPFKNIKLFKSNYLALIRDFNFSPTFSNLNISWNIDRQYVKTQLRNSDLTTNGILPTFQKYYDFNRMYSFRWNLTKSLSLDYTAHANAVVDEPSGEINTTEKKDSILTNLKHFGRIKNFDQDIGLTYQVPLSKIPFLDWTNADIRYDAGYIWTAGAIDQADTLGNTAQNSRNYNFNGKIDFVKLYNKWKFLRSINSPPRSRRSNQKTKADTTNTVHRELKGVKGFLRLLMMLRSVNFSINNQRGTVLPGFLPRPFLLGMDSTFSSPGWGFILGSQDINIKQKMVDKNWLARSEYLTFPFTQFLNNDFSVTGVIEPFNDFRIQIAASKKQMDNYQEIFRYGPDTLANGTVLQAPQSLAPTRTGSYSISIISISTAFSKDDKDNNNPIFNQFVNEREVIRDRLNALYPKAEFKANSQDVIIPAFLAAYTGRDPLKIGLTSFPKIPLPNWRIDYAGLSKIPALQNVFSSINITHSYSSTYNVSNYTNSLDYENGIDLGNSIDNFQPGLVLNENGEPVPVYVIGQAVISETFAPLVGIDLRTKSKFSAQVNYKLSRDLALNISNSQVTEVDNKEFSIDLGYTKSNMKLPFKYQGATIVLKNDIQFRTTFAIRNMKTVQRKINDLSVITGGNTVFQLRPTIKYMLNDKLSTELFLVRNINNPLISNTFKQSTTTVGVQVRFSLAQ